MYLIIRCVDCKFLSSFNKTLELVEYCSDFSEARLFESRAKAEQVAFYCTSKVLIVKSCGVFI